MLVGTSSVESLSTNLLVDYHQNIEYVIVTDCCTFTGSKGGTFNTQPAGTVPCVYVLWVLT